MGVRGVAEPAGSHWAKQWDPGPGGGTGDRQMAGIKEGQLPVSVGVLGNEGAKVRLNPPRTMHITSGDHYITDTTESRQNQSKAREPFPLQSEVRPAGDLTKLFLHPQGATGQKREQSGETEAAKTGICFLSEQPPETDKMNGTNNSGGRWGLLVDFGVRRVSREKEMKKAPPGGGNSERPHNEMEHLETQQFTENQIQDGAGPCQVWQDELGLFTLEALLLLEVSIWAQPHGDAAQRPCCQQMGFHHDGQAGLELLTSGDPPTSASQSARITGMSHHAWLNLFFFYSIQDSLLDLTEVADVAFPGEPGDITNPSSSF
ncbi:Protein GVQW1 [Plecturocebus cupreus]